MYNVLCVRHCSKHKKNCFTPRRICCKFVYKCNGYHLNCKICKFVYADTVFAGLVSIRSLKYIKKLNENKCCKIIKDHIKNLPMQRSEDAARRRHILCYLQITQIN